MRGEGPTPKISFDWLIKCQIFWIFLSQIIFSDNRQLDRISINVKTIFIIIYELLLTSPLTLTYHCVFTGCWWPGDFWDWAAVHGQCRRIPRIRCTPPPLVLREFRELEAVIGGRKSPTHGGTLNGFGHSMMSVWSVRQGSRYHRHHKHSVYVLYSRAVELNWPSFVCRVSTGKRQPGAS